MPGELTPKVLMLLSALFPLCLGEHDAEQPA